MEIFITINYESTCKNELCKLNKYFSRKNIKFTTFLGEGDSSEGDVGWLIKTTNLWEIYNSPMRKLKYVRVEQMNNSIMATLDSMNLQIDCSANCYEWKSTGNSPYHPFIHDCQCAGDPHYRIKEVPVTTIRGQLIDPMIKKELFEPIIDQCQFLTQIVISLDPNKLEENGFANFETNITAILAQPCTVAPLDRA